MNILFGMYMDGAVWSNKPASMGEVRTGPLGLLGILETRLGLSGLVVHPVRRMDEYMKRLAAMDGESAWFHPSFAVDPWSTARQLLEWRDELTEAGWQGKPLTDGSPRLNALCDLESVDIPLSLGREDRLRKVIDCLLQKSPAHIVSVSLKEPLSMLPPGWRQVMDLLRDQGTQISGWPKPETKEPENNLSRIQAVLSGSSVQSSLSLTDDSLVLLKAANEWEAAEHLALWLAADPEGNKDVTILCGTDTGILDQALQKHGLPALGRAQPSRWREAQQVLPLMLANAWLPVDIRPLVDLLSLTESPFPRWVCRILLKAISEEPGVGGRAWNAALEEITEKRKQDLTDKNEAKAEAKSLEFIKEIQSLLVLERFDPDRGIPEDKLRERCQKVVNWLGRRLDTDLLLVEVAGQAREMQELSGGKGFIPRITLERMLETVIGMGSTSEGVLEEAAPWQAMDHPGSLADPCGELVWWGFNDTMPALPTYWSAGEREALQADGVILEECSDFRRREAYAWQQGLMAAQRRFMAIYIVQMDGEEAYHHPYWDVIWCAASKMGDSPSDETIRACLVRECKDLDNRKEWAFAGRRRTLALAPVVALTSASPQYTVPASLIGRPEELSYSQMSTLIGCPMKWALEYHARLHMPKSQEIPTGSRMIGTFCHRIVEELFATSKQWDAIDAGNEAGRLFDSLLPSMASELLLEGRAIERQRYKSSVMDAVRQLVQAINRLGLRVEKTEAPLAAVIDDIPFSGFADLLLRDRDGHPFVLDMKWSASSRYRRREVEEGSSLQLAAYAWMLGTAEGTEQVHSGYFMLAQGRFLSDSPLLGGDAIDSENTLEETWDLGVASMNDACRGLDSGLAEARGVMEAMESQNEGISGDKVSEKIKAQYRSKGMLYLPPPCKFCDFGGLCGLSGGIV